jgi:hypothetical protein
MAPQENSPIGSKFQQVSYEKASAAPQIQNRSRGTEILRNPMTPPTTSTGVRQSARFPDLKPSTTAISIRLPSGLLEQIKIAANERDVPYQSLIKMWLAEKVR